MGLGTQATSPKVAKAAKAAKDGKVAKTGKVIKVIKMINMIMGGVMIMIMITFPPTRPCGSTIRPIGSKPKPLR